MRFDVSSFRATLQIALIAVTIATPARVDAQGPGRRAPAPPPARVDAQGRGRGAPAPARAQAPIDLTGYWVSVVTEDWRYRMVTPTKGDYQGVPMTPDAVKVADAWNPEADTAAGAQCRSYGAGAIMRVPGRVHITWDDDRTLRLEADAGTQTRMFRFEPPSTRGEPSWQGDSVASWET